MATTTRGAQAEDAVRQHMGAFMSSASDSAACRVTVDPWDLSGLERGTEITTTVEVDCADVSWISLGYMDKDMLRAQVKMERE